MSGFKYHIIERRASLGYGNRKDNQRLSKSWYMNYYEAMTRVIEYKQIN